MRYSYAPASAAADARALAVPPAPGPTHRILRPAADVERGQAAPAIDRLRTQLTDLGGIVRVTRAVAEEIATCMLVDSMVLRFRLGAMVGYIAWIDSRDRGVTLLRPYPMRMTTERLLIMLGLKTVEERSCPTCGRPDVRVGAREKLYVHKTPQGGKCSG